MRIDEHQLTAYALGELDGDDCEAVEAHLMNYPDAQKQLDAIRRAMGLMTEALASESTPGLDGLRLALLKKTAGISTTPPRASAALVWGSLAAAAIVALAAGLLGYTLGVGQNPAAPNESSAALAQTDDRFNLNPVAVGTPEPSKDPPAQTDGEKRVELKIKLPKAHFPGTPKDIASFPRLQPQPESKRPPLMVPPDVKLISQEKPVNSSSPEEFIIGKLSQITDGDHEAMDGSMVILDFDKQWVQIDLEEVHEIHAVLVWHRFFQPVLYRDVIVQTSDDPDFIENVVTLFNNDHDNSYGLGVGKDYEYFEEHYGKLMPVKRVNARYLRLHTNGNTEDDQNHYIEIKVFGRPIASGDGAKK